MGFPTAKNGPKVKNAPLREVFRELYIVEFWAPEHDYGMKKHLSSFGNSKNSFTNWAKEKFPEIKKIFDQLKSLGVPKLTGTGSTLFLSFKNEKEAQKGLEVFPQGILVRSLDHSPLKGLME